MEIVVITGPTYEIALPRAKLAVENYDGIELRFDLFEKRPGKEQLLEIQSVAKGKTTIFTFRSHRQGGGFKGTEIAQQRIIEELVQLEPSFFDIEYNMDPLFIKRLMKYYPKTMILLSYHDFIKLPRDLSGTLAEMEKLSPAAYKIACTANSENDSYKMLRFIQQQAAQGRKFTGICMGEFGKITRTDGIKSGNFFNYRILHATDNVAPGLNFA